MTTQDRKSLPLCQERAWLRDSETGSLPACYLCQRADRVKLLGVASIPLPPKNPETKLDYLDPGLVSLGVRPLPDDRIASMIYVCQRCNLIWRPENQLDTVLASRLDGMPTVDLKYEKTWLERRSGFFSREFLKLKRLAEKPSRAPVAFLDIGCSYGHLLDIAHQNGWQVAGVDASKTLIEHLAARQSYPLFHLLLPQDSLPFPDSSFDLVTFYDSFAMMEDPLAVINHVYDKLKPGGYLLLRLSSRNYYVRLWILLQRILNRFKGHREIDATGIFGDTKYSYSINSFTRLVRMSKFGEAKVCFRLLERGKRQVPLATQLVYLFGLILSWCFLRNVVLTPSFTAYVQKEAQ